MPLTRLLASQNPALVEHPLQRAINEGAEVSVHYLPIIPQVYIDDGRRLQTGQPPEIVVAKGFRRQQTQQGAKGKGADIRLSGNRLSGGQFHPGDLAGIQQNAAGRASQDEPGAQLFQELTGRVTNGGLQACPGKAHVGAGRPLKHPFLDYHQTHCRADIAHIIVQGGFHQQIPQVLDGAVGLAVLLEPLPESDLLQPGVPAVGEPGPQQTGQEAGLIQQAQVGICQERGQQMEGSGQWGSGQQSLPSPMAYDPKAQAGLQVPLLADAEPFQEVYEVGAATDDDVLSVVHRLPGCRIGEGEGPPSQELPCLHQSYPVSGVQQGYCGGDTGNSAANYYYIGNYIGPGMRRGAMLVNHVCAITHSFSVVERLTRRCNTS